MKLSLNPQMFRFTKRCPVKWALAVGFCLFCITFLHIHTSNMVTSYENHSKLLQQHIKQKIQKIEVSINKTILSSDGSYQIISNVVEGSKSQDAKVTLISHCSINHLYNVIDIAEVWHGPLTVTVYAPGIVITQALQYLLIFHRCNQKILNKLNLHLVTDYPSFISIETGYDMFINCSMLYQKYRFNYMGNYNLKGYKYPNNLLRNVGIRSTVSPYVAVIDIDMIISDNAFEMLTKFLMKREMSPSANATSPYMVFVVPVFEMKEGLQAPKDKKTLLRLNEQGLIRPFYYELCQKCQRPTNYKLWKVLPISEDTTNAYSLYWKDPWEPFYVSPRDIPLYSERFKQYGFNRISQACELHIAGYSFNVLDNIFLVHQGFKTNRTFHSMKTEEQEKNRLYFREFKEDLKAKYPSSKRRCH